MISSTARILRQEGHGVHVYEIRQKSQKALHKYNKLTLANLSDCEFVAGTGKCVVFTSSLPLATGVILREIAKLVYMHKLQGEGHVLQFPIAGNANVRALAAMLWCVITIAGTVRPSTCGPFVHHTSMFVETAEHKIMWFSLQCSSPCF